jgi:hypothetical protein
MGEKGSTFIGVLSSFIFGSAQDQHMEEEVVEGLVSAHTLNVEGKPPLNVLKPKVKKLVTHEVVNVNPVAKAKLKGGGGFVDFLSPNSGPAVQSLAERVDRRVSQDKLDKGSTDPVEIAKKAMRDAADEVVKRAGW